MLYFSSLSVGCFFVGRASVSAADAAVVDAAIRTREDHRKNAIFIMPYNIKTDIIMRFVVYLFEKVFFFCFFFFRLF